MKQKGIKAGILLTVIFFTFSCSTSNNNQGKPNLVKGKGYCVHKYGDNGCLCTYQYGERDWICQSGPTTVCEDNKSRAGQCIEYAPDLDEWEAKQREEANNADSDQSTISQSND